MHKSTLLIYVCDNDQNLSFDNLEMIFNPGPIHELDWISKGVHMHLD